MSEPSDKPSVCIDNLRSDAVPPSSGEEWIIDAWGCRPAALTSEDSLRAVFVQLVSDLLLRPIGSPLWHTFPSPGGITGLWLLSESHLCCHTFPETGYAAFNLYCCRPRPRWDWAAQLGRLLGAAQVEARCISRGGLGKEGSS